MRGTDSSQGKHGVKGFYGQGSHTWGKDPTGNPTRRYGARGRAWAPWSERWLSYESRLEVQGELDGGRQGLMLTESEGVRSTYGACELIVEVARCCTRERALSVER
jgi:hypothetical protein